MTNEQLRMQMLSGVITEGQYKTKLEENKKPKSKKSLKENFVGIGAINNPFAKREKTGYETAFEHFLGEKYELKEEMEDEIKEVASDDVYDDIASELGLTNDEFDEALNNSMVELDMIERIYFSDSYTRREAMSIIADLLKL
jgi:hypothetical protein